MATFTKQVLADTLKEMVKVKPIDKITVTELVDKCNINRQTFYYHFQDIYDLLGWIYRSEAVESIENQCTYETWQEGLITVFDYMRNNEALCLNTYRSLGREHLERFLNDVFDELVGGIVDEISKEKKIEEDQKIFITKFYSYALCGTLLEWLSHGMRESNEEMERNISTVMDGSITNGINQYISRKKGL